MNKKQIKNTDRYIVLFDNNHKEIAKVDFNNNIFTGNTEEFENVCDILYEVFSVKHYNQASLVDTIREKLKRDTKIAKIIIDDLPQTNSSNSYNYYSGIIEYINKLEEILEGN